MLNLGAGVFKSGIFASWRMRWIIKRNCLFGYYIHQIVLVNSGDYYLYYGSDAGMWTKIDEEYAL